MNGRVLRLMGKISRKSHALLSTLWDYCVLGIEKTVVFKGIVYRIVNVAGRYMIRIHSQSSSELLGLVRDGEIFQCA